MGCTTPQLAYNSPTLIRNLTPPQKQTLKSTIESNNLPLLAIQLTDLNAYPNSQLSEPSMGWMLIHLCCRWDADFCLHYLLRVYFMGEPESFVGFVNGQTMEGYTCLHLCAIWGSLRCVRVLHGFGGLYLGIKDNKLKTPYQYALQYKCGEIASLLQKYKALNIQFLYIQVQKIVEHPLLPTPYLQPIHRQHFTHNYTLQIQKQLYEHQTFTNPQSQHQRQLLTQKSNLELQLDKLLEQKLKIQLDYDIKRALICVCIGIEELEKEEFGRCERERLYGQLEKERRVMVGEIQSRDRLLGVIHEEIRKMEREKLENIKNHSNQRNQEIFAKFNEQLANKLKQNQAAVKALKQSYILPTQPVRQSKLPHKSQTQQSQMDTILKTLPSQIATQYHTAKQHGQFTDPHFPPNNTSIGSPISTSKYSIFAQNSIWLRPSQFFKSEFQLFDGIHPDDIKQGSLGVCYMLATLSALAANPENIRRMFVFWDLGIGFYVLKLFVNGRPEYFVVDDLIPCNKTTKSPLFTQPIGKEIWVLLLEKAWVKLVGSYLSAQSMTPDYIMQDLTGAPGYGWWLTKQNLKTPTQKIKQIVRHCQLGHIVVITSNSTKKIEGIVNNHAYSLLSVYQYNKRYIFKIRNPWGRFQWNGEFSHKSKLCTPEFKKRVGYQDKQDGIFFISENQLLKAFQFYSISHVKTDYHYSYSQFKSKKWQNIFYKFKLDKSGDVNIRITQPFQRMIKTTEYQYSPMIFQVGKICTNQVQFISQGHHRSYFGAKSVHAFDDIFLNMSQGQYFVRILMIWKDQKKFNEAVVGVYGPTPVLLERLSEFQGMELLKSFFISFSRNFTRYMAPNGFYRICTMKGQFLFIAQTEEETQYRVNFKFIKNRMVKTQADISKISQVQLQTRTKKGVFGVCTAMRTDPAQGGTTGPVSITFTKLVYETLS